jgi:hypothetical protein
VLLLAGSFRLVFERDLRDGQYRRVRDDSLRSLGTPLDLTR